jgi:hypothetical protein
MEESFASSTLILYANHVLGEVRQNPNFTPIFNERHLDSG